MRDDCIPRWRSWKYQAPGEKVWIAGWNGRKKDSNKKPKKLLTALGG